jgi:hypothetical protein
MRQPFHLARVGALACALAACAVATAQTMNDSTVSPAVAKQQKQEIKKGDPARWYKPDSTRKAQVRNKEKEIAAALKEEQAACRKMSRQERSRCMKDARVTYQQDMSDVRALVSVPDAGGFVITTTTSAEPTGIEATGSSQGGATQGAGDQDQGSGMHGKRDQGKQDMRDESSQDTRNQETGTQDNQDSRKQ